MVLLCCHARSRLREEAQRHLLRRPLLRRRRRAVPAGNCVSVLGVPLSSRSSLSIPPIRCSSGQFLTVGVGSAVRDRTSQLPPTLANPRLASCAPHVMGARHKLRWGDAQRRTLISTWTPRDRPTLRPDWGAVRLRRAEQRRDAERALARRSRTSAQREGGEIVGMAAAVPRPGSPVTRERPARRRDARQDSRL